MGIILFVLGILLFIGLVLIHEWGHFIMARRGGVKVEEFGLGFPPQAKVLTKKNGTIYTLNWLPLGGFVRLKGEHDSDRAKGTFGAASLKTKIKIMMAGVFMNLVTAVALFTIVALIGMPKLIDNQTTIASDTTTREIVRNEGVIRLSQVIKDSPAERAGIQKKDEVVSINGQEINKAEDLSAATEAAKGQAVTILLRRDNQTISKDVQLNQASPYLGVGSYSDEFRLEIRRSTWSAPIVAVGVTKDFTVATLKGVGNALAGLGSIIAGFVSGNQEARQSGQTEASGQVAGPVGIFSVLYSISQEGIGLVLFIIGLLSLTLAIMNALPIPALDGGRLFVTLLFRGIKKPLAPRVEDRIHGTGFAVLMALFVLITYVDVRRIFQ